MRRFFLHVFVGALVWGGVAGARATGPLESLAQAAPYGPDRSWPVLTAAQWTGDPAIDAVVLLSIDDMRDTAKYEKALRPILNALAEAGAPGALSIFTNSVEPGDPQLQAWIKEGLSIEVHTIKHPCPMLCQGNLGEAKKTFDDCVELLSAIPNMRPVASRVPCCDSMNSASPRFFSEIFNRTTPGGKFLPIDSSVFQVFTVQDPALPEELMHDEDAVNGRFGKYLPFPAFTTTITNYPYPYVIGNTCWEFPCIVPSDWEAQHRNQPNAPQTVEDMKAAIDATVLKQGTYTLCFHPHGWIQPEQVAELVAHAKETYGPRVKFLSFAGAEALLREQLLQGQSLRREDGSDSVVGGDNGVRLIDVNGDGFMDVVIANASARTTRVWQPESRTWKEYKTPFALLDKKNAAVETVVAEVDGVAVLQRGAKGYRAAWRFNDGWKKDKALLRGLEHCVDALRAIDLDRDGRDELVTCGTPSTVRRWDAEAKGWNTCSFTLPEGTQVLDAQGRDEGLRFVDVDEDCDLDVVYSDQDHYGVCIFEGMERGWSTVAMAGKRGEHSEAEALPPIAVDGTDNGFWVAKRTLWWHNERTDTLPDRVDRRSFAQLLANVKPRAKSVAEATATMHSPGRDVVAVAAEPLVRDPVCLAWDARGRLWTAEMRDYPLGLDGEGKPGSEIRVLEDENHDGIYDKATVFLDGLAFASGVIPWRNGALVTCAPEIFYAEDRDGDGKAEYRETLFEGFGEGNQQHRINGLRWGVDGWIYAANGDSNGRIKCLKTGEVVDIRGRDVRFNPDTGELQTVTGNAQFGRSRDDYGRWFGCANWSPMWAYTYVEHYQGRNPFLPAPDAQDFFIASNKVYPVSVITERFNDQHMAGMFTSACGVEVYRDARLGAGFEADTHLFTCEPVHNLVFHAVGDFVEGGFKGGRAPGERASEFLASTDPWFRPVMTRTGPDGALYVADMYRQIIEHPEYISEENKKILNFRAGEDEGRIWRVSAHGDKPQAAPDLTQRGVSALVETLKTPNGALRDLAQQRLFELNDAGATSLLMALAEDATAPGPARVAALWLLARTEQLTAATVSTALDDPRDGVVLNALPLSEPFLKDNASVQERVLTVAARAAKDAPALRVQAAYTLGEWNDARAWAALEPFFAGGAILRAAALSSVNTESIATLWPTLLTLAQTPDGEGFDPEAHEQVFSVIAGMLLKRGEAGPTAAFAKQLLLADAEGRYALWQWRGTRELLDTIERFDSTTERAFAGDASLGGALKQLLAAARARLGDAQEDPGVRALAASLVGREPAQRAADVAALAGAIDTLTPTEVLQTTLAQLRHMGAKEVAPLLLARWSRYSPALQGEVAEVLFSRQEWLEQTLAALEKGTVSPRQMGTAQRQRLLTHDIENVRTRAAKVFGGGAASGNRQAVIERYRGALSLAGNRDHGKAIFTERCSVCHLLEGVGHRVGADLGAVADRRPEALIISMLDPNRAVETRYLSYDVETKDLSTINGILTDESATSITVASGNGQTQTVLRSEIASIHSTNRSIMPEGLEENLSQQDVADLLSFVAGSEAPAKQFAGNSPQELTADAEGAVHCTAENAEVRGTTLVYEARTHNLGFWGSADDHAVWRLRDVPAGEYHVTMEYCCDNTQTGNVFRLLLGDNVLSGKVHGTGTWDNYKTTSIGTVRLTGKEKSLSFAADGALKGYLIDLRSITLSPVK